MEFLRGVIDESGLSVSDVQGRFTETHFGDLPIPSVSTVYRRLSGEALATAGRLVDAIVDVCTPPTRLEAVQDKANRLKAAVVRSTKPQANGMSPSTDRRTHLEQLTQAQQRIIALQEEVARLKDRRQDSETSHPTELTRLQEDVNRTEAERRRLATELATARREIRALKAQLAAATAPGPAADDPELDRVEAELRRLDPDGSRFAAMLRRAFDVVYDGARTGRFRPDQLSKVEKAHLLAVVESELHREFGWEDGELSDFRLCGVDVDCKFSQTGAWSIPRETVSRLCLLVSADDTRSSFSVGLLRITPETLNTGRNRDGRSMINAAGRASMRFLVRDAPLPENALLHTDADDVAAIFAEPIGTARVTELFRRVRNRTVDRASLRAVAMQEDAPRRARDARRTLAAEGLLVLGHANAWVCAELELPQPALGEFVSVRVARRRKHHGDAPSVELEDVEWVVATPEDPIEPAPVGALRR